MSSFSLRIIASDHIFYDGSCEILTVPAHDGPVSILAHHEAVIMATQEGEVWFRAAGNTEWQEAIVGIGIVQVVNNRALVIVDSAERPEDIDVRRAQEALERAEEQMRQKQSIQEFKMSLARARARLKGSRHYQGL